MAPAFVTVPDSLLSQEMCDTLNAEFEGAMFIHRNGRGSHMWNGKTVISFCECTTRVLRMKRAELGLTAKGRAFLFTLCLRH